MKSTLAGEVAAQLDALAELARRVGNELAGEIAGAAAAVLQALDNGNTLFFCGNGGSAADAQHLAAEYVVRLRRARGPLPAIALTTDTSLLTAAGNDLGFDQIFARQVEALAKRGDLLFLHSTSGESANLIEAARVARERGVKSIALLAKGGGRLKSEVDLAILVPTEHTAHAQEMHLAIGHAICEIVETRFFKASDHNTRETMDRETLDALHEARAAEREQAAFYRRLASAAEDSADEQAAERLNGLHADEQHQLARITARLIELGEAPRDIAAAPPPAEFAEWEEMARVREREEVKRYEALLDGSLDQATADLLREILDAERQHEATLTGKWMGA